MLKLEPTWLESCETPTLTFGIPKKMSCVLVGCRICNSVWLTTLTDDRDSNASSSTFEGMTVISSR